MLENSTVKKNRFIDLRSSTNVSFLDFSINGLTKTFFRVFDSHFSRIHNITATRINKFGFFKNTIIDEISNIHIKKSGSLKVTYGGSFLLNN